MLLGSTPEPVGTCKRSADKPDRTAVGALAGLKALQLSTREECGLVSGCLVNGGHLESRAY